MNARCEELAKILDAEREKLTIEEPMDSKRLRLGLMDPPAGAYNQYFTNHFFADAEIRGLGMNLNTIDHCLRDDKFTMEQIRVIAGYMRPFSGEFLDYAGLRDVWKYLSEFIEMINTIDEKEDLKNVCRALMIYMNYVHAWTHFYAPWGAGGSAFNFRSKEERAGLEAYFASEDALKKAYPFDRGQKNLK